MSELRFRPLDGELELARLGDIEGWSFGVPSADSAAWLTRGGLEHVRVALLGERLVGGLLLVPMGQWFGGKSVPMTGIAGVGVAAEARGRGVARRMMAHAVRELYEQGVALSTLYPATVPLYRSAGYELAGCRFEAEVRPSQIGILERELEVRAIAETDHARLAELYRARAVEENGYLDRGEYIWSRVRAPGNQPCRGWLVEHHGVPEGYVYLRQKANGPRYDLLLTDLCAVNRRALRRLWTFLGDHRSLAERVLWHAGPADPFVTDLPEYGVQVRLNHHWMLRVVEPVAALGARGYPLGLRAELDLEVIDELLGARHRLHLSVADGAAEVRLGGTGALRLDVKGLAALFSGFSSPRALVVAGLATGDADVLERARSLFALPMPTMPDMF